MAGSVRQPFSVNGNHGRAEKSPLTRDARPGPAGSHPLRSAIAARFGAVRGMRAAVVVTAIVLVAVTAALAWLPNSPRLPAAGRGPGAGDGRVGHRAAGLLPGLRPASPPYPAERAHAGVCARGTRAIQPVPGDGAGHGGLGTG